MGRHTKKRRPHGLRGLGYLYRPRYGPKGARRTSAVWWWDPPGKLPRVSTGCRDERDAHDWRIQRLAELGRGSTIGLRARAVTFADMVKLIKDDYKAKGNRSLPGLLFRLRHLEREFGGRLATEIPDDAVTAYVAERRQEGAAVATINLELRHLRRMFKLARKKIPPERVPEIVMLKGEHVRRDWLSDADLAAILAKLPAHYRAAIEGIAATGWREDEILGLDVARVDFVNQDIRLDTSKTDEPRRLSFTTHPELRELLERQRRVRLDLQAAGIITPWVFPARTGGRIGRRRLQKEWVRARVAAGVVAVEGPYIHGLRRKMSKELIDAGVGEQDAMGITGHKSPSTFRRYAIRDRQAQERAFEQLRAHKVAQAVEPQPSLPRRISFQK